MLASGDIHLFPVNIPQSKQSAATRETVTEVVTEDNLFLGSSLKYQGKEVTDGNRELGKTVV